MNMLGAEKSGQAFAGNLIDGWEAPPLNALASKSPKPWTREQLVAYLRTGLSGEHGAASGPMRPVTQHMADVPEADVRAIATYILSLDTKAPPPSAPTATAPTPTPPPAVAAAGQRIDSGAALFTGACAGCHAATAPMGTISERPSLGLSTAINSDSARNAIRTVLGGNPWNGSTPAHFMPPFADALTDAQIAEVLAYVRASSTPRPAWPDLEKEVAHIRNEASPK